MRITFNYSIRPLIFGMLCLSCRRTSELSHTSGRENSWQTNDSLAFYFPQSQNPELGLQYTKGDTFRENWYSSALFSFREPILYNNYSQEGTYRFLWLRSFHRPVVFVLSRSKDQVSLTTKILDRQPEFKETKYYSKGWNGLRDELKGKTIERVGDSIVIVKADRKAAIVFNQTKRLGEMEWTRFEQLLQNARFWNIPANADERGMDGAEWIIEGLLKDKYRFVVRWSPENTFRDAGVYLINLSGLKEEIY